ncbi:DUF2059 domain-containing protein [bacterium]|jgi:hypothetical protein|nr:DUF2059 domain-containing protein [bacterium]
MKKLLIVLALCTSLLCKATSKKEELARELVNLMPLDEISKNIQWPANVSTETKTKFAAIMEESKELSIKLHAKHYTEAELEGTLKFYNSDIGKKTLEIIPKITAEQQAFMQDKMMELTVETMKDQQAQIKAQADAAKNQPAAVVA